MSEGAPDLEKGPMLTRAVVRHPWVTLLGILALTVGLAGAATRLHIDVDPWIFLSGDHPLRIGFEEFQATFDVQEPLLIGIERPAGIFESNTLRTVLDLTEWLEDVELVDRIDGARVAALAASLPDPASEIVARAQGGEGWDSSRAEQLVAIALERWGAVDPRSKFLAQLPLFLQPVIRVTSLHTVEDIRGDEFGLTVEPLMEQVPETAEGLEDLAKRALDDPLLVGALVNAEATATAILAEPSFTGNQAEVAIALYDALRERIAEYESDELSFYIAGSPAIAANMSSLVFTDLRVLVPFVLLVLTVVLVISFRSVLGVAVPVAVVVISVIWTLGIMGLVGIPYSFIMSAMPVLLIAIGSADGIHVISEYELHRSRGLATREAIFATMGELNAPVVLTSITSSIGFASLRMSDIVPIGHLGLCVAIGILSAMVFSLTFIPAVLELVGDRGHRRSRGGAGEGEREARTVLVSLGAWIVAHRRSVGVAALLMGVLMAGLATRVQVREDSLKNFDFSTRIRGDGEAINRLFAGAASLYVMVDTGEAAGIYAPSLAAGIDEFQRRILEIDHVGRSLSFVDSVKRINRVLHEEDSAWERVPREVEWVEVESDLGEAQRVEVAGREQIAQFLLLYESGGGERLENMVDGERRQATVMVQASTFDSALLREMLGEIREVAATTLPGAEVDYTGFARLQPAVSLMVVQGQIASLSVSFVVVAALMCVVYRSLIMGLIGMAPLVLTIATNFAIMAVFEWPLNIGTAIVASTALGIGIDYSIHVLSRFDLYRKDRAAPEAARDAFAAAARGILINAVSVGAGFLVLTAASFVPVKLMGILVASAMVVSAITCLVMAPAMLAGLTGRSGGRE